MVEPTVLPGLRNPPCGKDSNWTVGSFYCYFKRINQVKEREMRFPVCKSTIVGKANTIYHARISTGSEFAYRWWIVSVGLFAPYSTISHVLLHWYKLWNVRKETFVIALYESSVGTGADRSGCLQDQAFESIVIVDLRWPKSFLNGNQCFRWEFGPYSIDSFDSIELFCFIWFISSTDRI